MGARGDRLSASEFQHDPYPMFKRLRREAPVWRLPGENAYLVSTWDLVAEATSRVQDFSNHFRYTLFSHDDGTLGVLESGAIGPDVFAGADPPAHTAQRRIFFSELVRKKIDTLEPDVLTLDEMALLSQELSEMASWTMAQLDDAIASSTDDDVLSAAAAGVRNGSLTREEAAFTLMVLVGAGAETTTSLIGSAIAVLAERPRLQDELRAEPAKVAAFIEEVLRFESPFRYHPRTAARSVALAGVEIPEGALVLLLWSSANRDEAVFEVPDEIVPGRRNSHLHFGFGRGIHHCVGAPLARLEARTVLTRLLERTKCFALDPDRPQRWADSVWIRRHQCLPVLIEPV